MPSSRSDDTTPPPALAGDEALRNEVERHYVTEAGLRDALKPINDDIAAIKGGLAVGKFVAMVLVPIVAAVLGAAISATAILIAAAIFD